MLAALDELVDERVDERLRVLSAKWLNGARRSEYLTVDEAADLLRANRQRVYDLCSSGRLTRLKDGSRTLIRRVELEAHLAEKSGRA